MATTADRRIGGAAASKTETRASPNREAGRATRNDDCRTISMLHELYHGCGYVYQRRRHSNG